MGCCPCPGWPWEMPGFWFYSIEHSNLLVPFFAKGHSSGEFAPRAVNTDPVYGDYIDNTDIGQDLHWHSAITTPPIRSVPLA